MENGLRIELMEQKTVLREGQRKRITNVAFEFPCPAVFEAAPASTVQVKSSLDVSLHRCQAGTLTNPLSVIPPHPGTVCEGNMLGVYTPRVCSTQHQPHHAPPVLAL